jgi:hypothetical protein
MAHATCLAAARHELLASRGGDVETQGMAGAPAIRVLASNRSIERAVRLLGIRDGNVVDLPLDESEAECRALWRRFYAKRVTGLPLSSCKPVTLTPEASIPLNR